MALIKCPECGHGVSDKAEICPDCGFAVKEYLQRKTRELEEAQKEQVVLNEIRKIQKDVQLPKKPIERKYINYKIFKYAIYVTAIIYAAIFWLIRCSISDIGSIGTYNSNFIAVISFICLGTIVILGLVYISFLYNSNIGNSEKEG